MDAVVLACGHVGTDEKSTGLLTVNLTCDLDLNCAKVLGFEFGPKTEARFVKQILGTHYGCPRCAFYFETGFRPQVPEPILKRSQNYSAE